MEKNRYPRAGELYGEQFYGLELAARRERAREVAKLMAAAAGAVRRVLARFVAKPVRGVRHA